MPEPRRVDVEALRMRLPDGWWVEKDGRGARGRFTERAPKRRGSCQPAARFRVRPEGDLWTAAWEESHGPGTTTDEITGTRERCVIWAAAKARGVTNRADD